ncbi:MAG: HU family DNA-binding protein [Oscillospiraceae bacterium]|nr:HU family DNA-binding protein [Oscillospiraceae bacterium]
MNKAELIATTAAKTGLSKKDTEAVITAALDVITAALAEDEKVQLVGFGAFETKQRAARIGRNPRNTEETIEIPATKVPVFKAGKALKDAVAK